MEGLLQLMQFAPGLFEGFDRNSGDVQAASAYGQRKGSAIGAGIGALLAPFTGGASIAIGAGLGGAIGSHSAGGRAADIAQTRQERGEAQFNMYKDLAEQNRLRQMQESGQAYLDQKLQIPRL